MHVIVTIMSSSLQASSTKKSQAKKLPVSVNVLLFAKNHNYSQSIAIFTDDKQHAAKMVKTVKEKIECYGIGRNCCLPSFSPIPVMFSIFFFFRAIKTCDYIENG